VRALAAGFRRAKCKSWNCPWPPAGIDFGCGPLATSGIGAVPQRFLPRTKTIVTFYGPEVDSSRSGSFEATRASAALGIDSFAGDRSGAGSESRWPGRRLHHAGDPTGVTATPEPRAPGPGHQRAAALGSNFMLDGWRTTTTNDGGRSPLSRLKPSRVSRPPTTFRAEYGRTAATG